MTRTNRSTSCDESRPPTRSCKSTEIARLREGFCGSTYFFQARQPTLTGRLARLTLLRCWKFPRERCRHIAWWAAMNGCVAPLRRDPDGLRGGIAHTNRNYSFINTITESVTVKAHTKTATPPLPPHETSALD